jgi:hypothetical protein
MKKILFSLIALMAVMSLQAQSIVGTWRTVQPIVENGANGSFTAQHLTYTFNPDGTFTLYDEFTQATKPSQTMQEEVASVIELRGSYSLVDDKLILNPNMETYATELLNVSQNGRVTNNAKVKARTNAKINSNEFKARFNKLQENTVRFNNGMLVMTQDGKQIDFVRFATIK